MRILGEARSFFIPVTGKAVSQIYPLRTWNYRYGILINAKEKGLTVLLLA